MSTARPSTCTTRSETSLSSHSSLEDWGSNKGSPGRQSSNIFSRFRGRPIGRLFSDEEYLERRSLTPQELLPTLKQQDDAAPPPFSMTMKPLPPEPKVPSKSRGFFSSPTTTTISSPSDESLVFGVDLKESIRLAPMRARISHKGKSTSSRDFPLSIYKCCEFILQSDPLDHSIFSTPGSTTNVFQLRTIFNTAPSYGETFSFVGTHFTPHDAASLILLYLSELPKPLVPPTALKGWIMLARQEGAIEPPAPRLLETGLDFWVDVLNRLPAVNRSVVKHLLGVFAGVVTRWERVDEADARQLAAGVAGAVFQNTGEDKGGKKGVHATLALAFLIKKRGEYEVEVGKRREKKEGFLPSTREIMEWKGQQ
ncbi:Rho GTPase activation protein [Lasiosphaeria hispida]|uniref:Rho GTPase activation protein n=1 Tax=Lasiosphaeria hispida TaxID=260671 RepID=A0AAJ0HJT2_9PEZI|nr:Rho GTPase activation protein [Lasiosphaeria hispida]